MSPRPVAGPVVTGVDERGLRLLAFTDRPVDVCFDGRRIWTFWTRRDTSPTRGVPALRVAEWPRPLLKYLDGHTRLEVRDSATSRVLLSREVHLGEGQGRIDVRNEDGVELGTDKSGKLVPTFAARTAADIDGLLDACDAVLAALSETGIEPFLAYGTLLGAVREGAVLGHDSDADLGYVSHHTDPVDVARESFAVQRRLNEQGWVTSRYSGAAFKVSVTRGGTTIGLDVFGGFLDAGRLHLMGEIGTPFESDWIFPLGTATLHERQMPVPARPEKMLEAMYGPRWRVPDPAFQFETPARTVRALNDWFRGTQPNIRHWERRVNIMAGRDLRDRSQLAELARDASADLGGAPVLDVGAGRCADALWLARQGLSVTAYDYVPRAAEVALQRATAESLDLTVRALNLTEWRSVLSEGALLAHDPRPRVVMARHVLDATSVFGRESLARLCSMALREGGRLLAEFHPSEEMDHDHVRWLVGRIDLEDLTRLLRAHRAVDVEVTEVTTRDKPTVRVDARW